MKKDFILTFLSQIIVLISGLTVYKLAITQFGDTGFSDFSLVRSYATYIYTFVLLGLGIAIPKYIAMEIGKNSGNEHNTFFAALLISVLSLFATGIIFLFFQEQITFLLFGDNKHTQFMLPMYVFILGLTLHLMSYSYYRAKMFFNHSNILHLIDMGLIPLLVFLFANNVGDIFLYIGFILSIINIFILIKIISPSNYQFKKIKKLIPQLFFYGVQRLPADFGLVLLLALPTIFSAHAHGATTAGYFAFSISILGLSAQVLAPIGLIFLPKISYLLGEKNFTLIHRYVRKLLIFSMVFSIVGTITYELFAEKILQFYLKDVELSLINISKNVMWGVLFYPFYVTMRNIVDAYYDRAYNTISIIVALSVFVFSYVITKNSSNSFIIALAILSLMTFYFIKPLLRKI